MKKKIIFITAITIISSTNVKPFVFFIVFSPFLFCFERYSFYLWKHEGAVHTDERG